MSQACAGHPRRGDRKATVVKELLEDLVTRGVNPDQKRLFVIDGSKALRTAINAVFGSQHPVQRCRAHIAGRVPRLPEGCVSTGLKQRRFPGFDAVQGTGFDDGRHLWADRRRRSRRNRLSNRVRNRREGQRTSYPPAPSARAGSMEDHRCLVSNLTDSMTR
jgi:mutator family transposase